MSTDENTPGAEDEVKVDRKELIDSLCQMYATLGKDYKRGELFKQKTEALLEAIDAIEPEYQVALAGARLPDAPVPTAYDGYEELQGELIVQSRDRTSREVWIKIPNRKNVAGEIIKIPGFAILFKEGRNGCWHSKLDYNVNAGVEEYYFEQAKAAGRKPVSGKQVILGLVRDEMMKKNRLGLGTYTFIDEDQFHLVNEEDLFAAKAAELVKVFSLNPHDPLFAEFKKLMAEAEKKYPLPVSRSFVASGPVTASS